MNDQCTLSSDAKRLLHSEGDHRLTEVELIQLGVHLKMISGWADRVPASTKFFLVNWEPILVLPRVEGFTREQLALSAYLQPLHSQLCALAIQVLWKAAQFIRAFCIALNFGDLIVAATMARSLMETAAAFGCETNDVTDIWKQRRAKPAPDLASLEEFERDIVKVVGQILFGTKIKHDNEAVTGIERTRIGKLITRAETLSESSGIGRIYHLLCDAVHPSFGANRSFWTKEPYSEGGSVLKFEASRNAQSTLGDLPFAIGKGALWSLQWLGLMWVLFERTRNDLCLTAKIYALPRDYYGVVSPGDPSGYCRCGSAQLENDCKHEFGLA